MIPPRANASGLTFMTLMTIGLFHLHSALGTDLYLQKVTSKNVFSRIHRLMKRSNLFHGSSRIGDDVSDLCIENTQRPRTINLQLKASGHENRPRLHPALGVHPATSHTTRMSREKLYKSATQLSLPRPLFHSINSYLNFNNSKAASLYGSEQYVDSSEQPDILKPLENKPQFKPLNRMLVAKYSDMEIQKELSDFFKVRPVKSWDAQS